MHIMDNGFVNIENKYLLTIEETSKYTNIGTKRIRELCHNKDCDFVVKAGVKILINRKKFEQYLDSMFVL